MDIFDLLFPNRCIGCGSWGRYICGTCLSTASSSIPRCSYCQKPSPFGKTHVSCKHQYGIDGVYSLYSYTGIVKKATKAIKYRFASTIVSTMFPDDLVPKVQEFKKNLGTHTYHIVPIPLHPRRFRWRGFNQAELIADQLSAIIHFDMLTKILRRNKETIPQAEIQNRYDRIRNMDNVFYFDKNNGRVLHNSSILLVDDVSTTGATLQAACLTLKKAGARDVWGFTIAHS